MAAMEFEDDVEGEEALREIELEDAQAQRGQAAIEQVPEFGAAAVAAVRGAEQEFAAARTKHALIPYRWPYASVQTA